MNLVSVMALTVSFFSHRKCKCFFLLMIESSLALYAATRFCTGLIIQCEKRGVF